VRDHLEDMGIDRKTGSCDRGNETSRSIKGGEFINWVTVSFSRRILLHGVS